MKARLSVAFNFLSGTPADRLTIYSYIYRHSKNISGRVT